MPVLRFSLARLQEALGKETDPKLLREQLPMLGCALEEHEGDAWAVELFPNRPDLLSTELLARALRAFLGYQPGLARYEVAPARDTLAVDPSIRSVRPHIVCGAAHGLALDDDSLVGLMGLQEDLHWGLGARRRKVSVGIHDARETSGPYTYKAVNPDRTRFVPLHDTRELTMRQMVTDIEKGRDYAHLVTPFTKWPLIVDAKDHVLSFPPIINGTLTTLTKDTTDVFVDVTGTDELACRRVLNIVMSHLGELGARLEAVEVKTGRRKLVTPDLAGVQRKVRERAARDLLGIEFTAEQAAGALRKMGHDATVQGSGLGVLVAPWRADVLHEVDLIEDIGIGLGYARFTGTSPREVTFGAALPSEQFDDQVRRALTGFGFLECLTLTLTSEPEQRGMLGATDPVLAVENPESIEQAVARRRLLPGLLTLAGRNTHRDLPQRLFENGDVIVPADGERPVNRRRVAGLVVASDAGFTQIKAIVEGLLRALGMTWREEPGPAPGFVAGRCARVNDGAGERVLGFYGEIDPAVIVAFGLAQPCAAFELELARPAPKETWQASDEPAHELRMG